MSTEQKIPNLKINLLTQSQYDEATINENELYFIKGDSMADYVVEDGLQAGSGWYWRKWNSGKIELWRWLSYTEALDTNWSLNNNWWYGAEHYFTYPFSLNAVLDFQISVDGNCFIWYGTGGTTSRSPSFYFAYPVQKASNTYKVYMAVRGTWK